MCSSTFSEALKITTCAIFYFALTAVVEGKLFPTRLETAKEDDGIEYAWLIVIPEDETAATGGKPAAIEGADDEADADADNGVADDDNCHGRGDDNDDAGGYDCNVYIHDCHDGDGGD